MFIGSCAGTFYALDIESGFPIWDYDIRQDGPHSNFHGEMLLLDDLVIVGCDGGDAGRIYAFNQADGKVRWQYDAGGGAGTAIIRNDSLLFFATMENRLIALDIKTGAERWYYQGPTVNRIRKGYNNAPALGGDTLFFAGYDANIQAFSVASGKIIWRQEIGSYATSGLLAMGANLYFGAGDSTLQQIRKDDGRALRSLSLPGPPYRSLLPYRQHLLLQVNYAEPTAELMAVDLDLTKILWKVRPAEGERWLVKSPFLLGDQVLSGTQKNTAQAFDAATGTALWSLKIDSPKIRTFGHHENILFVGTIDGVLYAWRLDREAE